MPVFIVRAYNFKQVSTKFERMGVAAVRAEPAMESVAELMFRIFEQIFNSGGRRGGGSWKRDTSDWLMRKQREGLDPRINHATLALRNAFTVRDAPHQELHVTATSVNLSTDLEYAGVVNRARPFIKFSARDRLAMRQLIRDYLIGAFKTA